MSIVFPEPPAPRRCSAQFASPQQAGHCAGEFRAVEVVFERAAILPLAGAEVQQAARAIGGQLRGARQQRCQGVACGDEMLRAAQVAGLDGLPYPVDKRQVGCLGHHQPSPAKQCPGQRDLVPLVAGPGRAPQARDEFSDLRRLTDQRLRAF